MSYPFWDPPLGYGVLMAVVAIVHVFISHFAIGGGLFLVVSERAARKRGDSARLDFLQRLSRFFVLITLVGGTLTGVGIWFVIGLLNPAATEALIHNFVWAWATEWTFFVVEILAAILYFYGWKTMAPDRHMAIGWFYFVFAWLSLFVINGILTFMLTPGRWISTGNIWDGFFNPTFWPSLVFRTSVSILLAGLYSLFVASRYETSPLKARLVRFCSVWGILGISAAAASFFWYWKSVPADQMRAIQSLPTPALALHSGYWLTALLLLSLVVCGLLITRLQHVSIAIVTMALGLAWFGGFEWFRESARKPYIISGFMYGNSVLVSQSETLRKTGYSSQISFHSQDQGADLFRHACGSCHTLGGYKSLKPAFDGTDRAFISMIVRGTDMLRGNMPPFLGTAAEADAIAGHIESRTDRRPFASIHNLQGLQLGQRVFQVRCGKCHFEGGARDNRKALRGLSGDDYRNILNSAADLGQGMPAFTAGPVERAALVEYLSRMKGETP